MFASIARTGVAVLAALTFFSLFLPWGAAHAVGTAAGTTITNAATATYSIGGVAAPPVVSSVAVRVDELISVRVTAPVAATNVNTPDINKVLAFTVTNVGNGQESFNMTVNLNPGAPVVDQFNPTPGSAGQLFLDNPSGGVVGAYDPTDTLIQPGAPIITLNADQSVKLFLVSNIPASLNNLDQGIVRLSAASTTVNALLPSGLGAAPGTILPNAGTATSGGPGIDAVVGVGPGGAADSGADDAANGTYLVASVTVTINKVVLNVFSPFAPATAIGPCNVASPPLGCTAFVPGTLIQYQVTVTIIGAGTAQNVQMTDAIPPNTTYVASSIRVNGVARTDAVDALPDNASCAGCGNATGAVTVVVGDVAVVAGTPVTHVMDYKVSIN